MVAVADHSTADHMTWDITDLGFRMGLSPQVPSVLARHVGAVVRDRLLAPHGLTPADVTGWAVHPGGRRILEVVEEQLHPPSDAMAPSYAILDANGNCSSATVLMVLEQLPAEPGPVVAMAFGPGLTLYAALADPPLTPDPSDRGSTTAEHVANGGQYGRFSHHFCVLEDSDALAPCRVRGPVPRARSASSGQFVPDELPIDRRR